MAFMYNISAPLHLVVSDETMTDPTVAIALAALLTDATAAESEIVVEEIVAMIDRIVEAIGTIALLATETMGREELHEEIVADLPLLGTEALGTTEKHLGIWRPTRFCRELPPTNLGYGRNASGCRLHYEVLSELLFQKLIGIGISNYALNYFLSRICLRRRVALSLFGR